MTWLYLPPSTSSAFAPASEDLNSDCSSHSIIADRLCEASVTSRGKLLPSPAWSRRWKRGGYILRLSGLTLEPSTADASVDAWISSLLATRAKETALPESAAANSTIAGFSTAPSTSSIKAGLQPSSAKTCRGTLTGNSPSQSQHWSDWAAALRSEYSARRKPEIRCGESGSSCSLDDQWPAPQARTTGGGEYTDRDKAMQRIQDGVHQVNLSERAITWASPMAGAAGNQNYNAAGNSDFSRKVMEQAETLMGNVGQWLAPLVADAGEKITLASHQGSLLKQANDFHPPSSLDQPITAGGSTSSTDGPNSNQPSVKRKLNPIFVEALMRWPTGLSGFVRPETALIQWQQLMPSYVSMLFSTIPEQRQQEMF